MSAHLQKDEVAGLAMLDASDADRRAAEAHASECPECGRSWASAMKMRALMEGLAPPPEPSASALQRAQARVHAELKAEAAKPSADPEPEIAAKSGAAWTTGLAIVGVGALGFLVFPHEASTLRYAVAAAATAVAAVLGSIAARSAWHARVATVSALGLSIALGAIDLRAFAMVLGHAESCFSTHVVACVLPLVVALWSTASGRGAKTPFHTAAAAACGAIAGQSVLLTACASEESFLHVVFFHIAGVVTAAVIGAASGTIALRYRASPR